MFEALSRVCVLMMSLLAQWHSDRCLKPNVAFV